MLSTELKITEELIIHLDEKTKISIRTKKANNSQRTCISIEAPREYLIEKKVIEELDQISH